MSVNFRGEKGHILLRTPPNPEKFHTFSDIDVKGSMNSPIKISDFSWIKANFAEEKNIIKYFI